MHEALIEIFRHRPSLAAELLTDQFGIRLPTYQGVRLDSGDLTNVVPTEYRADAVIALTVDDTPTLAVILEVQLGHDHGKRWSWPVYLATLRARLHCPTVLLVVCTEPATASWCATTIELGHPGLALAPLVMGPNQVPVITDLDQAGRSPELAVLSAMAHPFHPERDKIFHALAAALDNVDSERATLYHDVVRAALPVAARCHLEALMSTGLREYQSEFVRKFVFQGRAEGRVEGKAEGKAEAVLAVLAARDVNVPADVRDRITGCTDIDQLDTWIRRAATASTATDLFDR